jgi:hypothetical protein
VIGEEEVKFKGEWNVRGEDVERVLELLMPPIFSFSLWKSCEECYMIYTIMLFRLNLNFCLILKKQSAAPYVNKNFGKCP